MARRAESSGISLTEADAAIVKGMLARGDRQHDVAAWFGVNGGRVGEIATSRRFRSIEAASADLLPPPGPYPSGREAAKLMSAIEMARRALDHAESVVRRLGS